MSWLGKYRRRKGGVYVWRTRKHAHPFAREWGYVGETTSFKRREQDHKGRNAYQRGDGVVVPTTEKPWMDLDAKMYRVIPLPWWLCWKWVLGPLETLVMLLLWPRYNHKKNLWNPRRISISRQYAQRAARDAAGTAYQWRIRAAVWTRYAVQAMGVVLIVAGLAGAWINR